MTNEKWPTITRETSPTITRDITTEQHDDSEQTADTSIADREPPSLPKKFGELSDAEKELFLLKRELVSIREFTAAAIHLVSVLITRRKSGKPNDRRIAQLEAQLAADGAQTPTSSANADRHEQQSGTTPLNAAGFDDARIEELCAPVTIATLNVRQKALAMELKAAIADAKRARSKLPPPNGDDGGKGGETSRATTRIAK